MSDTLFPPPPDPGYGDPNAPEGSPEWAKRWRLNFQSATKDLKFCPERAKRYLDIGLKYRAWTLVVDENGDPFTGFENFCEAKEPYGLGMPYPEFHGYMVAKEGKNAVGLLTVSPGQQGERTDKTSTHRAEKCRTPDQQTRLRAILRAPEIIQDLYRQELVSQGAAVLMGPQRPDEQKAAQVVRARQAVQAIPRPDLSRPECRREYRRRVDAAIREVMGKPPQTPAQVAVKAVPKLDEEGRLTLAKRLWHSMTQPERTAFTNWIYTPEADPEPKEN